MAASQRKVIAQRMTLTRPTGSRHQVAYVYLDKSDAFDELTNADLMNLFGVSEEELENCGFSAGALYEATI